jgi:hypothetical protein
MVSSGLLRRVALVRTDVSEEPGVSFIRVTKISELGTTQAATSNRRTRTYAYVRMYVRAIQHYVTFEVFPAVTMKTMK